jgi:hypothetical protein
MDEVLPIANGGQAILSACGPGDLPGVAELYRASQWTPDFVGQLPYQHPQRLGDQTLVGRFEDYEERELVRLYRDTDEDAGRFAKETVVGFIVREAQKLRPLAAAFRTLPPRNVGGDPAYLEKVHGFLTRGVSGRGRLTFVAGWRERFVEALLAGKVGGTMLILKAPEVSGAADWVMRRAVERCLDLRPDLQRMWTYYLDGVAVIDPCAVQPIQEYPWAVNHASRRFLTRRGFDWLAHEAVPASRSDPAGPTAVPFHLPGRSEPVLVVQQWSHLDGDANEILDGCRKHCRPIVLGR